MSILQIIQYPDLRLRRISHTVSDVGSEKIKKVISNMLETLKSTENCAALAATQLNIEDPPSVVVINSLDDDDDDDDNSDVLCLINPRIIDREGSCTAKEGCMSIFSGDIYAEVKRSNKIKVAALDTSGKQIEFETEGYFARCIQHECDHLNGVLYIDRLSKLKRSLLEKKMLKLTRK